MIRWGRVSKDVSARVVADDLPKLFHTGGVPVRAALPPERRVLLGPSPKATSVTTSLGRFGRRWARSGWRSTLALVVPLARMQLHALASPLEVAVRAVTGRPRRRGRPSLFERVGGALRRDSLHGASLSVPEVRRFGDAVAAAQPFRHPVDRQRAELGGVPVEWMRPRADAASGAAALGVLLYVQGGSYLMGSAATRADRIAEELAAFSRDHLSAEEVAV